MDLTGRTIAGTYRVERKLGEGGMGAVYRAIDVRLDRAVALKVIRSELARSDDFALRFEREAKAAARFNHANSVDIYAFGEDAGLLYMALEFVEGRELARIIKEEGALEVGRACAIARQVLAALAKAHDLGIVHRDLKPQNVMVALERGGEHVKILDFGIAKVRDAADGSAMPTLTTPGMIIGTLAYMSPEQAAGEAVDGRSDLYSVGIILFEMLTGRVPFSGRTATELLAKQIGAPPPPPRSLRAEIPEGLEATVLRALAKKPEERFATAEDFSRAIDAALAAPGRAITVAAPIGDATAPLRARAISPGPEPVTAATRVAPITTSPGSAATGAQVRPVAPGTGVAPSWAGPPPAVPVARPVTPPGPYYPPGPPPTTGYPPQPQSGGFSTAVIVLCVLAAFAFCAMGAVVLVIAGAD